MNLSKENGHRRDSTEEKIRLQTSTPAAISRSRGVIGRGLRASFGLMVAALFLVLLPANARAELPIQSFEGSVFDASGNPDDQAGAHPYEATTSFKFPLDPMNPGSPTDDAPAEDMKTTKVSLPPGFIGNPQGIPECELGTSLGFLLDYMEACPANTQVGVATIYLAGLPAGVGLPFPIFNLEPPPGVPARFGFNVLFPDVTIDASVRPGDHGLDVTVENASQSLAVRGADVTFWGVPAVPAHDDERLGFGCDNSTGTPCPAGVPEVPLLTNPTNCAAGAQTTTLKVDTWQDPGNFTSASFDHDVNGDPMAVTGCEGVPFDPAMNVRPTVHKADAPTGLAVNLSVPQFGLEDPKGLASAHLKRAKVILPRGMAVNPSAASGLGACSPAQIGLGNADPARCPDSSKIGSVAIDTPLLEKPMDGSLYLAEQGTNPFNSLLALYLVAEGPGVVIKLPGKVTPDPVTGQLTASFDDNPQLPFTEMRLRFNGGDRAPLVTPPTCGTYQTIAKLTPWSAADPDNPTADEIVTSTSEFTINRGPSGGPCLAGDPNQPGNPADLANRPFNPTMNAGVSNPVAGASSPFILRLTRQDGGQEILATTVTPPQGVTAKLAGVPLCSNAQANAGTCPAASQIGEVIVGAGAGPSPFYIQPPNQGHVYMTGPYKGEQLGMLIQVPAKAGPFDLGLVNVRAAVHVDKHTAQLRVISDPIPQILEGIPLRVKDIRVLINRPDFTIAPTDCDPMTVQATVRGSSGASAHLINRFQVGGCASLGFNPRLKLDFGKRRKDTRRNQHPPLHANLNFNQGDANISYVQVALPKGVFLDQDRLGRICSRPNYAANTCPAESRVGYAKATTPLLDDPVEGPVYLKSSDNPLPDLAADLNGQIDIDLFGKIDQKENKKGLAQIRNTFDVVPDVPVRHFSLTLSGGKDGLLVNSRNICRKRRSQKVSIEMRAHNEAMLKQKPLIGSACKKINKKKAKRLRKKIKKLRRKAKKANSHKRAKRARHKGKKLKKQLRKLRR